MNTAAVLIGLFYGVISAVVCYVVAMITSGLFSRSYYQLYARVLIGICSVMLLAPGLRWTANINPQLAAFGLTLAHYAVMGVLGYGVYRFNRDFLKQMFLEKKTTAYFTFGTLANAAVVTLAFLHLAITGTPSWNEYGGGYVGAGHYGPLLVLLAAMVFHTDYYLKQSVGDLRRFSRFTFIGYAVSFLGLALSTVPYMGRSLDGLGLPAGAGPLLQNFFSAQALLIAILVYAWLVWRYESIPPLFLLLLAIVGEYHVLVTQWVIQSYGPASWGLASLPLFAGLAWLDHYFANWDRRKRKLAERTETEQRAALVPLRFAMPFRFVESALGVMMLGITLWTRFHEAPGSSAGWLAATFVIYACFFAGMAIFRNEAKLIYVSGLLAGLAALLGLDSAFGLMSTAVLGALASAWGALAFFGERRGLKLPWRTPIADCCLLSAVVVTGIVFLRHLLGEDPYLFQPVGFLDAVALGFAALAFAISALQYRSWMPVFGVLIALATMVPPWGAAIGFAATVAAAMIERSVKKENAIALEGRVRLFGTSNLPFEDVLPELFVQPLSMGAIPLALAGLFVSASHVVQGNFGATILVGAITSALVLFLLTRTYRVDWLYVLSLAATYFAVHATVHGTFLTSWPASRAIDAHLLVATSLSLVGWGAATAYASWCGALLRRVAEEKEPIVCNLRHYYAGILYDVTVFVAGVALALVVVLWISGDGSAGFLCPSAFLTFVLFAFAASVYRSQIGVYVSLTALTVAVLNAFAIWHLPRWDAAAVVAGMGLFAAVFSCLAWGREPIAAGSTDDEKASWKKPFPGLNATGFGLWLRPLGVYAIVCSSIAVVAVLRIDGAWTVTSVLTPAAPLTFAMAAGALLLSTRPFRFPAIYVAGIALLYATAHAFVALAFDQEVLNGQPQLVHLVLTGALALVSCVVAATCAVLINTQLNGADEVRRAALIRNREFYAGLLQHFALAASCVTLLALAGSVIFDELATPDTALMSICIGLLLAATFSLSGAIYHSRFQTYGALAAATFSLHGTVTMLVPEDFRVTYQTLVVAASALAFGVISWLIVRFWAREDYQGSGTARRFDCWEHPPLPLTSLDGSLWARPLAHVSVLLALLAIFLVGRDWLVFHGPRAAVWLTVAPIYLVAATLFVATKTHRFGWLRLWRGPRRSDQENQREAADLAERGTLYVMSLVAVGLAIHLTAQLLHLESLPFRMALSWHLGLSALLAIAAWSLATYYMARCERRLKVSMDSDGIRREASLYGGLLHHVAVTAAALMLAIACTYGIPPTFSSAPLLGSIGLLILFFGLASVTYRSKLGTYTSLLTLGLASLHLASLAVARWPEMGSLDAPVLALVGLLLILLASVIAAREQSRSPEHPRPFRLPSPWLRDDTSTADGPLAIWVPPLREGSIFYAITGLAVTVGFGFLDGSLQQAPGKSVITCLFAAATFVMAARLYDTSLLTYAAAFVATLSTIPYLLVIGEPAEHLGITFSIVAMLFWTAGFVVDKFYSRTGTSGSEPMAAPLIRIYERPLIRCSAVLAMLAIGHSLLIWKMYGWLVSQTPLVVASALGAVTLMLNARSLRALQIFTRARLLVYLGCASITACTLTATSMVWNFNGLGPSAAITAMVLSVVGLLLIERARAIQDSKPSVAESRLTFGEPISVFASGLSLLAVAIAVISVIGSLGWSNELWEKPERLAEFDLSLFVPAGATLLISAAVCLLTVRAQREIRWLYVAVVFGSFGLCLLVESQTRWSLGAAAIGAMILMNVLVACARIVRGHRDRIETMLGVPCANCERPFYEFPLVFTTFLLVVQSVYLLSLVTGWGAAGLDWPWLGIGLLSGGLFFHLLYFKPQAAMVHLLGATGVECVSGVCLATGMTLTPDVALCALAIGWGIIAGYLNRPIGRGVVARLRLPLASNSRESGERLLLSWSVGLLALSVVISLPVQEMFVPAFPNVAATLLLVTIAGVIGGLRWRSVHAETVSALLFPLCLASGMHFYARHDIPMGIGSLIAACVALAYFGIGRLAQQRGEQDTADSFHADVGSALINVSYALTCAVALTVIACVLQSSPAPPVAAAMTVISVCWLWMAWASGREILASAAVLGFFVTSMYTAHALLGIPLRDNPVTAFFVIGFSFVLYGVNVLTSRAEVSRALVFLRPTYYAALALPILLIVAIPFDQKVAAAFTLLAAGSFYLLIAHQSHVRWSIYVAAVLFNVAIYLWLPAARELTGLYQLYVIPAAITVLIFAQLHRHELKPQVLTSIRLASTGAILAISTLEVFFTQEPSLLQFVAVLLLSLAGITSGIALRIKPFVYVGVAFLVLNVVGQLGLQFHREGGVARAVILIGVGVVVLGAMIFFNIHRERILRQYRGFLADESWE